MPRPALHRWRLKIQCRAVHRGSRRRTDARGRYGSSRCVDGVDRLDAAERTLVTPGDDDRAQLVSEAVEAVERSCTRIPGQKADGEVGLGSVPREPIQPSRLS